jgi:hypothetical protein
MSLKICVALEMSLILFARYLHFIQTNQSECCRQSKLFGDVIRVFLCNEHLLMHRADQVTVSEKET